METIRSNMARRWPDVPGNINLGRQSTGGAVSRSQMLTVTTRLRRQDRQDWPFLEQLWVADDHAAVMP